MVSKKSSVIIAAILALCCVLSTVYLSCSKPKKGATCDDYRCQNGGYCSVDTFYKNVFYPHDYNSSPIHCNCDTGGILLPHCNCPSGYEGTYCESAFITKYLREWDVTQTVISSDSAATVGRVTKYSAFLLQSGTPTTFFINNICDSSNYNNIICTIDSTNSRNFVIDTLSAFHMFYQHFKFTQEGIGTISADDSTITATLWTRHLNYNVNWQNDVLKLVMKPHHQ